MPVSSVAMSGAVTELAQRKPKSTGFLFQDWMPPWARPSRLTHLAEGPAEVHARDWHIIVSPCGRPLQSKLPRGITAAGIRY